MADISDAFIVLPGGLGTLEEFFEVLNAAKIGIHNKPCFILNIDGYFDHLLRFIKNTMLQNGFLTAAQIKILKTFSNPDEIISLLVARHI